ncbi:hypothetical protein HPCPY6311_1114 [Helicobacter pylori CPY6311]|nr:hypothetical protein HPCPY6311_1114 [Helicobacter pylori CPY6311]
MLSLLTIQRAGKSANEQPYTTKELEAYFRTFREFRVFNLWGCWQEYG